ncbi:MAG: toprim domain-containing protein [Acidiferrobacterales bacterium]
MPVQASGAAETGTPAAQAAGAWARYYLMHRAGGRDDSILRVAVAAGVRVLPAGHPAAQGRPCILWPMLDPARGRLVGIQREWGRGHVNKKMLGLHMVPVSPKNPDVKQSAGFMFPGDKDTLYICEGQISAAAVAAATRKCVAPMFDTSGMMKPPRPLIERAIRDGATRIIIAGDSGAPGIEATEKCIAGLQTWGLQAKLVWTAPPEDQDWADIYEKDGPEAVRQAIAAGVRSLPVPPQPPEDTRSLRPWRPASPPAPGREAGSVESARSILKNGIREMVRQYCRWLENPEQQGIEPWLFGTTTGTGKSTLLRDLIRDAQLIGADGACLALVPDHAQASTYKKVGWWHYYGRSPDPLCPGYCPNHTEMMKAVSAGHIPQNSFCHRCPNGLKWSIANHGADSEKGADALDLLHRMGYDDEQIAGLTECVWQTHLRETQRHRFVVACMQSYSETLALWLMVRNRELDEVHRLVVVDEGIAMAESVSVGMQDLDRWARRAADRIKGLRQAILDEPRGPLYDNHIKKLNKQVAALEAAIPIFPALAVELAKWTGRAGRLTVSTELGGHVQVIISAAGKAETAEWERLEFGRDGSLIEAPLRAAHAIAETLSYGDGHVEDGQIAVSATKPILDRLGKLPVAFFDATPDPVTRAAVRAAEGHEVQAIAKQNVRIIRHPQKFWGLTAWKKGSDANWREREKQKYLALRKLYPDAAMLVHCKVHDALDPDRRDPLMGHWGAQHRAHDAWAGRDLVIVGGFYPPLNAWRAQYQSARIAALAAGADPTDWPEWPDDMKMGSDTWINESGTEVQSRHPMPADPRIRAWLLDIIGAETAQAIGRARGANLTEPVTVRIFGGWPLADIGRYGLSIDSYEHDPVDLGPSRAGTALDARQMIAGAMNAGERTIRRIQAWVRERTDRTPGIDRVRTVLRELASIARSTRRSIEDVARAVAGQADAFLADADGNFVTATIRAARTGDRAASMLLDLALQVEESARTSGIISRTGPPVAAAQ